MPKKTKKQKIASQRRKLHFFPKTQAQPILVSQPTIEKNNALVSEPVLKTQPTGDTITVTLFKKDLLKSLTISGIILAIVFAIFIQQQFGILPISSFIK